MPRRSTFRTTEDDLRAACAEFWHTYFTSIAAMHARRGRAGTVPVKDRNLGTTDARHVTVFEGFWRRELARALRIRRSRLPLSRVTDWPAMVPPEVLGEHTRVP